MREPGTTPAPFLGDVFARRYRLIERLGADRDGDVFRARDDILARDVAVKAFRVEPQGGADPRHLLARARVLTALDDPSLVTLYDADLARDGQGYLVMEFINGPTLREHLDTGGPLPAGLAAAILRDVAQGLATIHELGIIHPQLTSSKVLLRPRRNAARPFRAILTDFGVTGLLGAHVDATTIPVASAYLPPERLRGDAPDAASDVYALGLLAVEALTGERPLSGGPVQEFLLAPLSYDPEIPTRFGYGWEVLLTAMTDPDPRARPTAAEAADLAAELYAAGRPGAERPEGEVPEADIAAAAGATAAGAASAGASAAEPSIDAEPVTALRAVHQTQQTVARRRRPAVWAWVTHYR